MRPILIAGICTAFGLATLLGPVDRRTAHAEVTPASKHWLLEAGSDEERFRRLEHYLGGFARSMWEVGYRYQATYDALADANLDLARYHWDKVADSIEKGYMKRPDRRPNARAMFLDGPWKVLAGDLEDGDIQNARANFQAARGACMACHAAERVPFMNDQPLFRRTAGFPPL